MIVLTELVSGSVLRFKTSRKVEASLPPLFQLCYVFPQSVFSFGMLQRSISETSSSCETSPQWRKTWTYLLLLLFFFFSKESTTNGKILKQKVSFNRLKNQFPQHLHTSKLVSIWLVIGKCSNSYESILQSTNTSPFYSNQKPRRTIYLLFYFLSCSFNMY